MSPQQRDAVARRELVRTAKLWGGNAGCTWAKVSRANLWRLIVDSVVGDHEKIAAQNELIARQAQVLADVEAELTRFRPQVLKCEPGLVEWVDNPVLVRVREVIELAQVPR